MEGVLHVSFLYVTSDDEIPFDVWQGMIPFSYVMESNETCEDMKCDFTHFIEQLSISLLGNGEIEVKAVLAFHSFFKKPVHLFNIEEITYEPIDIKEVENVRGLSVILCRMGMICGSLPSGTALRWKESWKSIKWKIRI